MNRFLFHAHDGLLSLLRCRAESFLHVTRTYHYSIPNLLSSSSSSTSSSSAASDSDDPLYTGDGERNMFTTWPWRSCLNQDSYPDLLLCCLRSSLDYVSLASPFVISIRKSCIRITTENKRHIFNARLSRLTLILSSPFVCRPSTFNP